MLKNLHAKNKTNVDLKKNGSKRFRQINPRLMKDFITKKLNNHVSLVLGKMIHWFILIFMF